MIDQGLIDEVVFKIATVYNPDKIILFGSYAKGIPNENSDLDLLVIKNSQKSRPERSIDVRRMLTGVLIPMDILVYTNQEVKESLGNKYSFVY